MSGLLTKQSVLEAKSSGKSVIDYEQVQQMTGGNIYKSGLSSLGALYSKYNPKSLKGKAESVNAQVDDIRVYPQPMLCSQICVCEVTAPKLSSQPTKYH